MAPNTYICAVCGKEKKFVSSEEDAIAEMKRNFGKEMTTNQCSLVCDPCYKEMGFE